MTPDGAAARRRQWLTRHIVFRRRRSAFGFSTNSRAAMRPAPAMCAALRAVDRRNETRAPERQCLVRGGEAREYMQVLILSQPVAQPLAFGGPHPGKARPEGLDDVHLVAVNHDTLAQLMQILAARRRPVIRRSAAGRAIKPHEFAGDIVERQQMERPAIDDGARRIERVAQAQAHVRVERCLGRLSDLLNPPAYRGERAWGQR